MTAAWTWMKRWGGALFGLVLAAMGAGWIWRRQRAQLLDARARLEISELQGKISGSLVARAKLLEQTEEDDPVIALVDLKIEANRRRILMLHGEPPEAMTFEEMQRRLRRLGYGDE